MSVGNDQFDAFQAAALELAQGVGPENFGFRRADVHAEDFASPVGVDADRDDHRHADHSAFLADFEVRRVDPQIRPFALNGAVEEGLDPVVDVGAQPADLAFRDPGPTPMACARSSTARVGTPWI